MSAAYERIAKALTDGGFAHRGGKWRCPAHDDRKPSLTLDKGEGCALVHCHYGCPTSEVVGALGLSVADLYDEPRAGRQVEDVYPYVSSDGRLLFEVVRFAGKEFRQRRLDPMHADADRDGYVWSTKGIARIWYRLPALIAGVAAGRTVYVVEGEKDVRALERVGEVATCNPGGALTNVRRLPDCEPLRGAKVVIVRDTDDPGRRHAGLIASALAGIAASVRLVDPAEGKDAADHLVAGHEVEGFVPVEAGNAGSPSPEDTSPWSIVTVREFAAVDEASGEALLGDAENTLLSAGGLVVFYGKGGGGKTTLEVDLSMHLAAGIPWLGVAVPRRCRVLLIENEGPRGMFRAKLEAKLAAWRGPQDLDYLTVLEQPWGTFTFADEAMRLQLAATVREQSIDIIAAGPVHRLGVTGGGTPEEVAAFIGLLEGVRAELDAPLAGLFVHHANKAGSVSGAWEGVPDTLAHVTNLGNGTTRVEWEKVRWGSDLHGRVWKLRWRDGESFELDETPEVTDEDIRDAVLAVAASQPGCSANAVEKGCKGGRDRIRAARDALLDEGILVNLGGGKGGAGGGGMKLYLIDDAPFAETPANAPANASPPTGAAGKDTVRRSPSRKGGERSANGSTVPPPRCSTCGKRSVRTDPGEPLCRCDDDDVPGYGNEPDLELPGDESEPW